ncbi:ribonuclease Z [Streptococcus pluranimalium]|uniref:Ribonuclease Z n=1 Tax=Streptococcus pluranimalium TaxID=82348 RepID=A0A2L0D4D9_9STRE|nr:ribonuclease Z [Streptococcus pluranimalium]AUW96676.1 ribonuclease Z [Streptococcus pluranimalium]
MQLQFLGTGAGQPAKGRNVSSLVLKLLDEINEVWMFDCGEGTQRQILETTIKPRKVSKIFITHLHGDHVLGLPGFLSSRAFQSSEEQTDIEIYGPKGIKSYVMSSLRVTGSRLPYRIHFHEFEGDSLGKIMETDKFEVYAEELNHSIFCVGYRVVQKDLEGSLDADALKAAGVPFGPLFGKIKNGQDVVLEDGTKIIAKDFISEPKKGKVVTILGDTRKTDASVRLGLGADVLVHESTYGKGDEKLAKSHGHSTNMQAAQVAKAAGAKRLLLNHISPRFLAKDCRQLERDAAKTFENVKVVFDLDEVEIG